MDAVPPLRALFIRPVFIALLNHGFLCFCQMSYDVRTAIGPLASAYLVSYKGPDSPGVRYTHIYGWTWSEASTHISTGPTSHDPPSIAPSTSGASWAYADF